jgi:hypothetical protein
MLTKAKTSGPGKTVRFKRRKPKRDPGRILHSVPRDWERWDEAAKIEGVNWSTFCRRALEHRTEQIFWKEGITPPNERPKR